MLGVESMEVNPKSQKTRLYSTSSPPSTSGQIIRHLSLTLDVVGASPTPHLQKRDEKL